MKPSTCPAPFLVSLATAVMLAGCGGGSSAAPAPAPPPPAPAPPAPVPPPPPPAPAPSPDVTVTLTPATTRTISPYVYGLNSYTGITSNAPPLPTFDRTGGNRWTAYNWENNASNAGSDYLYESDNYLSSSTTPAEAVRAIVAADRAVGAASLVTIQMQGWVAADETGPVSASSPPDTTRFKPLVFKKSTQTAAAFTTTPSTSDGAVYMDEFAWALDQKFAGLGIFAAGTAVPTFVELDNEPELWNSTHLEVQGPTAITSDAYIAKTVALTKALKDQFPAMTIVGPAHYGFGGLYSWQGELSPTPSGANWFTDKYLAAVKRDDDRRVLKSQLGRKTVSQRPTRAARLGREARVTASMKKRESGGTARGSRRCTGDGERTGGLSGAGAGGSATTAAVATGAGTGAAGAEGLARALARSAASQASCTKSTTGAHCARSACTLDGARSNSVRPSSALRT